MSLLTQTKKYLNHFYAVRIQNRYNLSTLEKAQKAIVFLVPSDNKVNGGIMSIFSLCRYSRQLNPDCLTILSTYPKDITYAVNQEFKNTEQIFRFSQIITHAHKLKELILHIPEYYASRFYSQLTKRDVSFLSSIPHLHINILNQNIWLMPTRKEIETLFQLTDNITQTMAHHRYATQEICNQWKIPSHLFSVYLPIEEYSSVPFEKKEKRIVLSPDENKYRSTIVDILSKGLPDWELITVQNLSFFAYMNLIGRSFASITFGEGFDGYFTQPCRIGGLAFSVYNEKFFPSSDWKTLDNVYESYEQMKTTIVNDILFFRSHPQAYINAGNMVAKMRGEIYSKEKYLDNLVRFYRGQYDFLPNKTTEK